MTDPQEASENVQRTAHSDAEPDQRVRRDDEPKGPDVGGPDSTLGSGVEDAVTGTTSPGEDGTPDSQSRNPL